MSFNILIAEHQFLIKQGLKAVIEEKALFHLIDEEIGQPANWADAIQQFSPSIFITDHQSFPEDAENFPAILGEISKHTNVLVISDDQVPAKIRTIIDSGVKGFLTKHCKPGEIRDALTAISHNNRFFCQEVMNILLDDDSKQRTVDVLKQLSDREYEVLELIGKGFTSKEISEKLFISIHTVNSHRKNLLRKLEMKSPTQLIVFALENLS